MHKIFSFFSRRYYLSFAFLLASAFIIAYDSLSPFLGKRGEFYSGLFSDLAESAVTISIFLVLYYLYREVYIYILKKWRNSLASIDGWLKHILYFLRDLHPFAGILAVAILLIHGYFFNFVYFRGVLNATTLSGVTAFSFLLLQGGTGICIKRWVSLKELRYAHRILALLFFLSLLVHKALT